MKSVAFLMMFVIFVPCADASDGIVLEVMSFNIRQAKAQDGKNHWNQRKDLVVDLLQTHDPDIVGLQEALRTQLDYIRTALPGYREVGEGHAGMTAGEYSAILYRSERFEVDESGTFWLSGTPEKVSKDWGNQVFRICTWVRLIEKRSDKAFYVYNTHLDHRSQPSREQSVMLMMERIYDRTYADPFILTGDFNMGEDNPAIRYLKGKPFKGGEKGQQRMTPIPLVDSFRVRYPDAQDVATFHWFQGGTYGVKIDSIFVTSETAVLDAAIIRDNTAGRYPSDHYPVTARLTL